MLRLLMGPDLNILRVPGQILLPVQLLMGIMLPGMMVVWECCWVTVLPIPSCWLWRRLWRLGWELLVLLGIILPVLFLPGIKLMGIIGLLSSLLILYYLPVLLMGMTVPNNRAHLWQKCPCPNDRVQLLMEGNACVRMTVSNDAENESNENEEELHFQHYKGMMNQISTINLFDQV